MIFTLMRIVLQQLEKAKLVEQLTKWGLDVSESERVSNEPLPELL